MATLETKFNRQNKEINFVRVYINWDSVAAMQQSKMTNSGISLGASECGMVQPMRARIAGRVTPTTNQSEVGSLEMIEIPLVQRNRNPMAIACCQISGNLLLVSNRIIDIYTFQVRVHDISKLRFIDFEQTPIYVELTFVPEHIEICENYIGCMSRECVYLFKLLLSGGGMTTGATASASSNNINNTNSDFITNQDFTSFQRKYRFWLFALLYISVAFRVGTLPTLVDVVSLIHAIPP